VTGTLQPLRRAALAALALLPLAGCVAVTVGSNDAPPIVYYQLDDARPRTPAPPATSPAPRLAIQAISGDPIADASQLVFSRRPGERSFYQFALWSERPSRRLALLAQQRFEAGGTFAVVTQLGQPIATDWLLTLALESMVHDVSTPPGAVRVAWRAELIRRSDRSRVGLRAFTAEAPAAEATALAAVAAFDIAVANALDQMTAWVESTLAAQPR
jgi:ABC-type uncharacterized transport system auxiliary subunit